MSTYTDYINYISNIINNDDLSTFKHNNIYNTILEHVSYKQGYEYLKLIMNEFNPNINDIIEYTKMNDSVGSPSVYNYGLIICSPSSLRYIYHTHLILTHMKNKKLNNINIVEVGGGYGGLCLCISYFSKYFDITILKYNIIDLQIVNQLIKKYLKNFNSNINFIVELHNSDTYGEYINDDNLFMISNYCYSEIDIDERNKYKALLLPKITHFFLVWNDNNNIEYVEQIKNTQICETERPLTGPFNKFVYS
jgi:hypothetical protein